MNKKNHFKTLPFLLRKYWRALVLGNVLVVMDADNELVAERLRLAEGVRMSKVYHIVAAGAGKREKITTKTINNQSIWDGK